MHNNQGLQATMDKIGLATQQDFVTDQAFVRGSPGKYKNNVLLDDHSKVDNRAEKLPMLTRQSPGP